MDRPTETLTLHFALPFLASGREAKLHVGRRRHALQPHTAESLAAARTDNRALRLLPDQLVTHFAPEIVLPSDAAQLLFVTTTSEVPGARLPTILLTKIHTPKAAYREAVRRRFARGPAFHKPHPALAMAGVQDSGTDPELPVEADDWTSAMDAAVQAVFQHGELLNVGSTTAAAVKIIITHANDLPYLAEQILNQAKAHQKDPSAVNWVFATTYSNTPWSSTLASKPRYVWSNITQQWMLAPMKESLLEAKNDPTLQSTRTVAGCYTVQDGITGVGAQRLRESGAEPAPLRGTCLAAPARSPGDSVGDWTVDNYTPQHGFTYNNDISINSDRILTASFTNSWVRWLSGYVEFLGDDFKTVVEVDEKDWTSQVPGGLAGTYDTSKKKYVALFSSVNTMIGYPLDASPTTISFRMPSNAAGVRFLAGGIGRSGGIEGQDGKYYGSWDQLVCAPGRHDDGNLLPGSAHVMPGDGSHHPAGQIE